jgi:predicted lipoprotein with Yx(FWY)xxD motif
MTRRNILTTLSGALLVALSVLAVAACGGGGGATAATRPKTTSGASATTGLANTSLGNILVDSQGRTLYLFKADSATTSACTGACASAWPPLLASGKPTVGAGADASLIGTADRSDGTNQVTYNGHPLYRFAHDTKAGDTNGQAVTAFGALWYVVSSSGNQITGRVSSSGTGAGSRLPAC